jgi:glycerol-3-phosphate dehydrogenase (NAD(P)+)
MNIAVIGAGSWGTALAHYFRRTDHAVSLWAFEAELPGLISRTGENPWFLPGFPLPPGIRCTARLAEALEGAEVVFLVVPAQHLRSVLRELAVVSAGPPAVVSCAKGVERGTLHRMSEVIAEELGGRAAAHACLSGPTFAREVAAGMPTAAVFASDDEPFARRLQQALSGPEFRFYRTADLVGVEMAGALKNIYAIASGMVRGLGYGANPWAALLTRGVHEMTRLCLAMGGQRETLSGLAGLGDLILTCSSDLSRNYQVGVRVGEGKTLAQATEGMRMVAEGVPTTEAALALARRHGVDLPIAEGVARILFEGLAPRKVVEALMTRSLKEEARL